MWNHTHKKEGNAMEAGAIAVDRYAVNSSLHISYINVLYLSPKRLVIYTEPLPVCFSTLSIYKK